MRTVFNKLQSQYPQAYSKGFNLHSFLEEGERVGPGHYRLSPPPSADGGGYPAGLCRYNNLWVRAIGGKIYIGNTEESTYTGDVSFAIMNAANDSPLLICSDGTAIKAYDKNNPTWSFQSLGIDAPADTFTLTAALASGLVDDEVGFINLAGGADDVHATVTIGGGVNPGKITYTAKAGGEVGNNLWVHHIAGVAEACNVTGNLIEVTLNSGVSTAASIKTLVDLDPAASLLVNTAVDTGGVLDDELIPIALAGGVEATYATKDIGGGVLPGIMHYQARSTGAAGNNTRIFHQAGAALSILVAGTDITITLDSGVTTVDEISALILATPAAAALVTTTHNSMGYMDQGEYWFRITYIDVWGHESPPSNSKSVYCANNNSKVTVSTIPSYTAYKAAYLRIYRTMVNGNDNGYDSEYQLVAELPANTTSYEALIPDVSLTESLMYGDWLPGITNEKPVGKNLIVWHDRLVWTNGNKIYYSRLNNYGLPLPGCTENYFSIGDDTDIVVMTHHEGGLLIWKPTGVYYMVGDYDSSGYFTVTIKTLSTAVGVSSRYHVVEWQGTTAFYSQSNLYAFPNMGEPLSESVAPLFSEYKQAQADVRLGVDHEGRIYVIGYVPYSSFTTNIPYLLAGSDRYYVGYVYDRKYGWAGLFNLDWLFMLPDYQNGQTRGLDYRGYMEVLDYYKAWEKSPASMITTAFTRAESGGVKLLNKITVVGITSHLKVGDNIYFYSGETGDPATRILYMSRISVIAGDDIGTEHDIFVSDTGVVGIGCKLAFKGGRIDTRSNRYARVRKLYLIGTANNQEGYFAAGFNVTTQLMQRWSALFSTDDASAAIDFMTNAIIMKDAYSYGLFNGSVVFDNQYLDAVEAGKK